MWRKLNLFCFFLFTIAMRLNIQIGWNCIYKFFCSTTKNINATTSRVKFDVNNMILFIFILKGSSFFFFVFRFTKFDFGYLALFWKKKKSNSLRRIRWVAYCTDLNYLFSEKRSSAVFDNLISLKMFFYSNS